MMQDQTELDRLTARRVTLIYRLEMIAQGARINYDDGTPVDMVSEKARLEDEVARLDRKILTLQPPAGQA
jgi:hypothetical protein